MDDAKTKQLHDSSPSPYCSDPNCQSCKELREMHEKLRTSKLPVQSHRSA
jgi:hypothetical protein